MVKNILIFQYIKYNGLCPKFNVLNNRYCQYYCKMSRQNKVREVVLPIGKVRIVGFSEVIPTGWEKMLIEQGRLYLQQLSRLLKEWSIVGFEIGALTGRGYGSKFWEHYGNECGQGFIILRQTPTNA